MYTGSEVTEIWLGVRLLRRPARAGRGVAVTPANWVADNSRVATPAARTLLGSFRRLGRKRDMRVVRDHMMPKIARRKITTITAGICGEEAENVRNNADISHSQCAMPAHSTASRPQCSARATENSPRPGARSRSDQDSVRQMNPSSASEGWASRMTAGPSPSLPVEAATGSMSWWDDVQVSLRVLGDVVAVAVVVVCRAVVTNGRCRTFRRLYRTSQRPEK